MSSLPLSPQEWLYFYRQFVRNGHRAFGQSGITSKIYMQALRTRFCDAKRDPSLAFPYHNHNQNQNHNQNGSESQKIKKTKVNGDEIRLRLSRTSQLVANAAYFNLNKKIINNSQLDPILLESTISQSKSKSNTDTDTNSNTNIETTPDNGKIKYPGFNEFTLLNNLLHLEYSSRGSTLVSPSIIIAREDNDSLPLSSSSSSSTNTNTTNISTNLNNDIPINEKQNKKSDNNNNKKQKFESNKTSQFLLQTIQQLNTTMNIWL